MRESAGAWEQMCKQHVLFNIIIVLSAFINNTFALCSLLLRSMNVRLPEALSSLYN
jgi:hypothetical protein